MPAAFAHRLLGFQTHAPLLPGSAVNQNIDPVPAKRCEIVSKPLVTARTRHNG